MMWGENPQQYNIELLYHEFDLKLTRRGIKRLTRRGIKRLIKSDFASSS